MKPLYNILSILIVLDLCGMAGLWFGYTSMQTKRSEEIELQRQQADEVLNAQKLGTLRRTLESVTADYQELQKFLFETTDESQIAFLSAIEQLGTSTTGVVVDTRTFELTNKAPTSFHGIFELSGSWEQMYHFLRLVESFPSRLVIERFDVRQEGVENFWKGIVSVDLTSLKK